jgi:tetratricopeptide (TPR) repeat protein
LSLQPRLTCWVIIVALLGSTGPARSAPEALVAAPVDEAAPADKPAAARAHYSRGLELYGKGDYAGALAELEAAYALVPNSKLLFSMGQAHAGLKQYAEAALALRGYLDRVGAAVPAERRAQVERQLDALRLRVGTLDVSVNVAGAEIDVDGQRLGSAPLPHPILLDAGRHRVTAAHPGHVPSGTRLIVIAGQLTRVHLDLHRDDAGDSFALATPLWIATGVLAAAALGSGIVALAHSRDYERRLEKPYAGDPASASRDLERRRSRLRNWLIASDVLGGVTVLTGGAALYFSLSPADGAEPDRGAESARPMDIFAGVSGRF